MSSVKKNIDSSLHLMCLVFPFRNLVSTNSKVQDEKKAIIFYKNNTIIFEIPIYLLHIWIFFCCCWLKLQLILPVDAAVFRPCWLPFPSGFTLCLRD